MTGPVRRDGPPLAPQTLAAHGSESIAQPYGDLVQPIHVATTYERATDLGYPAGRAYSRDQSPAYDQVETLLSELEGGRDSLLFASGLAGAAAIVQALQTGDRILAPRVCYWGWRKWLLDTAAHWGLQVAFYENGDADDVARQLAAAPTRLVWIETPANPSWEITDIAAVSALARAHGALVAVDSTVSTPVLTRPLALGGGDQD